MSSSHTGNTGQHGHDQIGQHYYVPQGSMYPFILACGMFLLALGFILQMNKYAPGSWTMITGAGIIIYVLFKWFGTVISESEHGKYNNWEDRSFRHGMIWFIGSEVMFFAAFFAALLYTRFHSVPTLGGLELEHGFSLYKDFVASWPTSGPKGADFQPMAAWGIPAINTALLLSSGATLTWAHWALLKGSRREVEAGLGLTVVLGVFFMALQAYEYHHAYTEMGLTLGAGVYGATFFMLTGFHGFHVTLGTIMLFVVLMRVYKGHFGTERHFAFEAVAWYWHFVDVVWLLLFVLVYWM